MGAGTLNQSNVFQQLQGGGGAGLDVTYSLEYGHFLFETGLDFRFLNSTSDDGFMATRIDKNYNAEYNYWFDDLRETRNMLEIGLPLMFGAQFNKFYFLWVPKCTTGYRWVIARKDNMTSRSTTLLSSIRTVWESMT